MVELYEHQKNFVENAKDKCGMFFSTGTGKTITALFAAKSRLTNPKTHGALIICPKGVKSKWQEAAKVLDFSHEVLTKEEFKKHHRALTRRDAVIVDEAHHFSGMKSQMHKTLLWYLKNRAPKYIWLLTATPKRRDAWNIYALARLLGYNWNYQTFRSSFFFEKYFGPKVVWLPKIDKETEQNLVGLTKEIGDVVAYEDCAEMPPVAHLTEYVEKTEDQKKTLEELRLIEANPLTFYMREHQIMAGIGARSAKDDRLLELAEEAPKLAVFCRYTAQINRLERLFSSKCPQTPVFVIDGATPDKNAVAREIEQSPACIALIQSDSAEGYELPSIHTAVFASMSYSYLSYQQSLGRFIRINQDNKPKRFFYLLTKGSIDEAVHKNILSKKNFDIELYSKR